MSKIATTRSAFLVPTTILISCAMCLLCLFVLPEVIGLIFSRPMLPFSALFMCISALIAGLLARKHYYGIARPSCYVIGLFLIAPPLGHLAYLVFIKVYGKYMGTEVDFDYPVYLWYLGCTLFSLGIIFSGFLSRYKRQAMLYRWDVFRLRKTLMVFILISAAFTVLSISEIGYIPILRGNIDVERISYGAVVGDYTLKFSRLWLIASILSTHLYFLEKTKKAYVLLLGVCIFLLGLYGQRYYAAIAGAYFFLIYLKHKRPKVKSLTLAALIMLILYCGVVPLRKGEGPEFKGLSIAEKAVFIAFGEWREYSYVINDFHRVPGKKLLKEDIFIGVLAALLPKEVWSLFGFDKDKLLEYNAAFYFDDYFNHYGGGGIRIGIIGECYAGFGVPGVIFIMVFLGFVLGYLENRYLALDREDPKQAVICFILSMLMFLPWSTFINFTSTGVFFGSFVVVSMLLCGTKLQPQKSI